MLDWRKYHDADRAEIVADGTICPMGIRAITRILSELHAEIANNSAPLDSMVWRAGAIDNLPKFGKRVRSLLLSEYGIVQSDPEYQILSSLGGQFGWAGKRIADLNWSLAWESGDYGDDNSCFWGSNAHHRTGLLEANCAAIRFHSKLSGKSGNGRAWVYPLAEIGGSIERYRSTMRESPEYLVTNSYSDNGDAVQSFATILQIMLSARHVIPVSADTGDIWLNSTQPYLVTDRDLDLLLPSVMDRWVSGIADSILCGYTYYTVSLFSADAPVTAGGEHCCNCGDRCDPEYDGHWIDDSLYCETCYCDLFSSCYRCGEDFLHDDCDAVTVEYRNARGYTDTRTYCGEYCANADGFVLCENCDNWGMESEHISGYCDRCAEEFSVCDHCGEIRPLDDCIEIGSGSIVCSDCLSEHYSTCKDCGEIALTDGYGSVITAEGEYVCDDCAKSYRQCTHCHDWVSEYQVYVYPLSRTMPHPLCDDCGQTALSSGWTLRDNVTLSYVYGHSRRSALRSAHMFLSNDCGRIARGKYPYVDQFAHIASTQRVSDYGADRVSALRRMGYILRQNAGGIYPPEPIATISAEGDLAELTLDIQIAYDSDYGRSYTTIESSLSYRTCPSPSPLDAFRRMIDSSEYYRNRAWAGYRNITPARLTITADGSTYLGDPNTGDYLVNYSGSWYTSPYPPIDRLPSVLPIRPPAPPVSILTQSGIQWQSALSARNALSALFNGYSPYGIYRTFTDRAAIAQRLSRLPNHGLIRSAHDTLQSERITARLESAQPLRLDSIWTITRPAPFPPRSARLAALYNQLQQSPSAYTFSLFTPPVPANHHYPLRTVSEQVLSIT